MTLKKFLQASEDYQPDSKIMFYTCLPFVVLRFYIYKLTGGKFNE